MKLSNMPDFEKNNSNNVVVKFSINNKKLVRKLKKSKSSKMFKSKKSSKSINLLKNYIIKQSCFLTSNAMMFFNHLQVTFTKTSIF